MNTFSQVPPGFRFHPTDEELVDYYLRRKIASRTIDLDVIKDVDLYKIEPWDLQELCRIGTEEQNEWYFFSYKDKKYPTGTRTNRATVAGFWKATGRDKAIYSKREIIGMRKTLVFYKGRAPNGQKSDWIMHEYRLETDENGASQEEGWVVCRVFKKKIATVRKPHEHDSPLWYDDQVSFLADMESPSLPYQYSYTSSCEKDMDLQYGIIQPDHFHQLPLLESPKMPQVRTSSISSLGPGPNMMNFGISLRSSPEQSHQTLDQNPMMTDWRVLDKFVASQLSQEEENDETSYGPGPSGLNREDTYNVIIGRENNSVSTSSSCQIDMWK